MRTLVTGGAGFIGSNLVDRLLERGDDVVAVDNLSTGKPENLREALGHGARLVEADIRDSGQMVSLFADVKPEVVFHLAARTNVRRSVADPSGDALSNVVGTVNVLQAAHESGAKRFVNISTGGAIYGETDVFPTPETCPTNPKAPYGQSKAAAEAYCRLFRRLHGLGTVTTRFANVYGPRQDPRLEAGVVAIFCDRLLAGKRPTIFGDGRQTRDFTFVGDVVNAVVAASGSDDYGPFNVGRTQETSVLDLIAALAPHAAEGVDFTPEFAPERKGEIKRSVLDCSKAERELGWRADVDIFEGMRLTLEWQRREAAAVAGS